MCCWSIEELKQNKTIETVETRFLNDVWINDVAETHSIKKKLIKEPLDEGKTQLNCMFEKLFESKRKQVLNSKKVGIWLYRCYEWVPDILIV